MAGAPAGYRTFTAGEVLTATNVQTFLQDQVIAVFADATARDAAITAPAEGQHCYLESDDSLLYYSGSAWLAAGGAGGGGFETNFLLMGA